LEKKEELILPLGQSLDGRKQNGDIVFLLPLHDGGWVLARRSQVHAVVGTLNLRESLSTAADRADRLVQRRARAPLLPCMAKRTGHLVSFAL
jgi:hypothetical protein